MRTSHNFSTVHEDVLSPRHVGGLLHPDRFEDGILKRFCLELIGTTDCRDCIRYSLNASMDFKIDWHNF